MKSYFRARSLARILIIAWAASASARALATAEDFDSAATIIVTGHHAEAIEQPPSTMEGVDADRLATTTNVINAEDSLRYLPSLLVRKRHVGDTQAPLATRTSGVGSSARSLIYADGVLLSALIGNNNTSASPRWGMVSPEEIARVDVLYGPFSAAYPGNSTGAVVSIVTRMPSEWEGSVQATTQVQTFDQYGTRDTYPAYQLAGTVGDRIGSFAWLASANHVASRSHPLAYVTVLRPAAPAAGPGVSVAGAIAAQNRSGVPTFVVGASGLEDQRQDNLKLKLALDVAPALRLTYRGGVFLNDTDATAQTYLHTPAGDEAYAGAIAIGGAAVTIPASAFSNGVYRRDERHWMHALSAEGEAGGAFEWQAIASLYDFAKDVQRTPSRALPEAFDGGPGSIVRMDGTGWRTLDLKGRWRPGEDPRHDLSFGAHYDRFSLASDRFATDDWLHGPVGGRIQAARGRTRTHALWLQDQWTLASAVELTLGARYEWWRAYQGFNFSLAPALEVRQPELRARDISPKASLRWRPAAGWTVTASAGQAYRFPTVSELYQAIGTGPTITIPDPSLRPERVRSQELAVAWQTHRGHVRLSLFNERIRNALISQSAPLVPGSTTLFNFVQNIPEVRTRGIELAFDRQDVLVPGFDLAGSVTLADPRIVEDPVFPDAEGKDIPQVPRRRATLVATFRPGDQTALTLAGRYSSRSFGTIDNKDVVSRTYQGFGSYLVVDARARIGIGKGWDAAVGVENIGNAKYFLFHPFPQRSVVAELGYRW